MDARTYLHQYGSEAADRLARQAGTQLAYFKQIAYGARRPSPKLAMALEVCSGGILTRAELRPDVYAVPAIQQPDRTDTPSPPHEGVS